MTYVHVTGPDTFTVHAKHPNIENDGTRDWDLREHGGVVYRCIQPHTNYDPGHTPNLTPALWTPQG